MTRREAGSAQGLGRRAFLIATAAALFAAPLKLWGQVPNTKPSRPRVGQKRRPGWQDDARIPVALDAYAAISVVMGCVSDRSAKLNFLARESQELILSWGLARDHLNRSKQLSLPKDVPVEIGLEGLSANTGYFYQLREKGSAKVIREICRFQTQRRPGSTFTFTVQGDSHPERPQMFHAELYARTLQSIASDRPDFHVCMGDDFSLAKLPELTADTVASRYALQRPFLGLVGQAAPIFLVNGNHEQASLYNYNQPGQTRDAAIWAQQARNRYFSLPSPDHFFSGNPQPRAGIGSMRDYYAWTWGDALFVVLDCYWHSAVCVDAKLNEDDRRNTRKDRDWWHITLGDEQYSWLKRTLETSRSRYKFVFAHHVMGTGRGGIERAGLYEWGGRSERGDNEFERYRPNWELPVHQLMAKHKVSVFFQGHDHLYAQQERDGVIYQTVPVPADPNYASYNDNRYASGVKHPNSGYLRVTVGDENAKVEYLRSYLKEDSALNHRHGEVTHSYSLRPRTAS